MTQAERIQKRLEEIAAELSAPRPRPADPFDRLLEEARGTPNYDPEWSAHRARLAEERRQLMRELGRLPQQTKSDSDA